jgi:hypothetical protein
MIVVDELKNSFHVANVVHSILIMCVPRRISGMWYVEEWFQESTIHGMSVVNKCWAILTTPSKVFRLKICNIPGLEVIK